MLWTLFKVRSSAILNAFVIRKGTKRSGRGAIVLSIVLGAYLLLSIVAVSAAAMIGMMLVLSEENLWLYFGFAGFMSLAICLVTGIFSVQSHIFNAKDNELLLSMPIPHKYILLSRVGVVLLPDLLFTFLINATAFVVYLFYHRISVIGALALLLTTLFVPMISFAVSALIGWIISIVTARLPKKNLATLLLFLVFFGGYMYFCFNANNIISEFMINSNSYAGSVSKIFPIYHMGLSIAGGSLISLLLWALCAILPFAVVYLILDVTFIKVVTTKRGDRKAKYVAGREREMGQTASLVFKESRRFFGSIAYLLNAGMGVIFLVLVSAMTVYKAEEFILLQSFLGVYLPMIFAGGICVISSMVLITASSVSLEGESLWIVRSMPVRSEKILYAKLIMHELFTAPFVLIASVVGCVVLRTGALDTLVLILLPQAYTAVCAAAGLLINLKFPKLDYISETQVTKQSIAVTISMFGGMGFGIALFAAGAISAMVMPIQIYGVLCTVVLAAVAALLTKLISGVGVKMFENL